MAEGLNSLRGSLLGGGEGVGLEIFGVFVNIF